MSAMAKHSSKASPTKIARHPTEGKSHCTGKVDATMPKEPTINI